jgi:hypothetical protein
LLAPLARAQSQTPDLYRALMNSATLPNGQFPSVYTYNGSSSVPLESCPNCPNLTNPKNFTTSAGPHSIVGLTSTLNVSIATALSVIPLASPASGVITKLDPATGAELPSSSTLGPIFTERAETIGKHRFYVGVSNQSFDFTSFNGKSLKPLPLLDLAGDSSNVTLGGKILKSFPVTSNLGMDVRLSQNVAFLTYGVTNRFDVSVGLPIIHSAISAHTYNAQIYVGNGFNNTAGNINSNYGNGSGQGNCWCVSTFTAGVAPQNASGVPNAAGLLLQQVNSSSLSKTGFGDILLRFKGTVLERQNLVVGVGTDLRFPTGDEKNFLGTGTTSVRPFLAVSLYTKPWKDWLVFSPHLNIGWQFAGKSILGGQLIPSQVATSPTIFGQPLATTKDYLPDVFSWAIGTELALGRRNTVVVDILGNQIGWIHGIQNMAIQSVANVPAVQSGSGTATNVTATGFVSAGHVSYGEYSGAFGYKARIAGNLVATLNLLVRFDSNGLKSRPVPLVGLSYTF